MMNNKLQYYLSQNNGLACLHSEYPNWTVLVNRLGGLSLPRKSVVRLTDRPDMTLDVYRGRKTTKQQQQQLIFQVSLCDLV